MTAIFKAKNSFLCLALLLFSGCGPVLSQAVIDESDPNVLLGELQRNPEQYMGRSVLFGGTIVRAGNDAAGSWVEVLQRPLGYRLEPKLNDQTGGRLLLKSNEIWDDQIFSKGRKITLVGKVEGTETRSLDEIAYDYPILSVKEYHLWPQGRTRTGPDFRFSFGLFGSF
jgi:outer membrane lipoprotein